MIKIEKQQIILSAETATRSCSLAVLRGGGREEVEEIRAQWRGGDGFSASDNLVLEIQQLLNQAQTTLDEIDLFAVVIGPGSFTGLRVGLAVVKGIAAARQIPLIEIPTLETMTCGKPQTIPAAAIISAGREEFFAQAFDCSENVADALLTGKLKDVLAAFKSQDKLRLIAASETHSAIHEFIRQNQIKEWSLELPPANLAVCAAKIALHKFQENKLSAHAKPIIYGRAALALRKKND